MAGTKFSDYLGLKYCKKVKNKTKIHFNYLGYFCIFDNVLDLNNQNILCLPSIFQFERTGTNLNHPNIRVLS